MDVDSNKSAAAPDGAPLRPRRFDPRNIVERLRDPASQRRFIRISAFVGLTSAIAASFVAVRHVMVYTRPVEAPKVNLSDAIDALDAGSIDLARELASSLRPPDDLPPHQQGGPAYVLGVAMHHDAEQRAFLNPSEARALHLLAARYLVEAAKFGFPAGREGHGQFILGRCRFLAGRYAASLAPLTAALTLYPEQAPEIHRLLARAYLKDTTPQPEKALRHIQEYLRAGTVTDEARASSLLTAAEIQFELRDFDACERTLAQIPSGSQQANDVTLLRGRMQLQLGDVLAAQQQPAEAEKSFLAARQLFERCLSGDSEQVRKARYLTGLVLRRLGKHQLAETEFFHTRHSNYDTPEGLAAGFEVAEVKRYLGEHEEAIHGYGRVLRQAFDMPVYSNPWISLDELRQRSERAYKEYFDQGDFEHAIQMADALTPLSSEENALEMQAHAHRAHADLLQEKAAVQPPDVAADLHARSLASWRKAASLYEKLARVRFATRRYPETVWQGAESYLNGQDYRRAARLLRIFLANEVRRGHPPALTALGSAELALGDSQSALVYLQECIEFFPRDPHSYRARLIAAEANRELGNLEQAKQLLTENLENEGLVPSSTEWRESLYALGNIYFREAMQHEAAARLLGSDSPDPANRGAGLKELTLAHDAFQQVILRLTEAVQRDELRQRDPHAPQTLEARYMIAESHRQAAKLPLRRLGVITIETTRNQLNEQIQHELSAASGQYRELQKLLNDKQSSQELSVAEEQILRNSYFSLADVLYDLEKYDEAIQAYATATTRYQNEPEALEAYVQIANCHRQLKRAAEARGTLERAKVVLNRIRPEADFTQTTRYTRDEWQQLLDWLITL